MASARLYTTFEETPGGGLSEVKYVRICGLETKRFPHGIALAEKFSKSEIDVANQFVADVNEYLNEWLKLHED